MYLMMKEFVKLHDLFVFVDKLPYQKTAWTSRFIFLER